MFEHKLILQIPGSFAAMLLFPAVVPTPHLTHQSSCFGWNLALVPMASVAPTPLIFSRSFENKGRFGEWLDWWFKDLFQPKEFNVSIMVRDSSCPLSFLFCESTEDLKILVSHSQSLSLSLQESRNWWGTVSFGYLTRGMGSAPESIQEFSFNSVCFALL